MMSCIEIMDFCIASCGVECAYDIALGFFFGLVTGLYKKLLFENHHILSFRTKFHLFLEPLNIKSFFLMIPRKEGEAGNVTIEQNLIFFI